MLQFHLRANSLRLTCVIDPKVPGKLSPGLSSQLLSRKKEPLDLDSLRMRSLGGHCSVVATYIVYNDICV